MPPTPPSPPLTPPCTRTTFLQRLQCPPSMPLTLLNILMLTVPSQCSLPSLRWWSSFPTCHQHCLPSLCSYSAHPTLLTILTLAVPSRHASNAAYHPYARSDLPTCLRHRLPSLCLYSACLTCL
ncbi:hypothetical protein O181_091684 [Austropuccinia psidii MF-1]|uniref:Uncharacterized protein n=1 Tax=Austropuccinia psidii MF-1 TaxID=1389203 RepID=A0A9Q3IXU5_9BASI|nr:hypothetical protein [Austropuccinia psidii MF-1]